MTRKSIKPPSIRDEYPNHSREHGLTPVSQRSGNKVGWETYKTRKEAEAVAKWAKVEAEIKSRQGYDFGYCSPGSIAETKGGYEVCIPRVNRNRPSPNFSFPNGTVMNPTITLRWRDEELTSSLTDAEAAAACDRIPADHPSRQYTQSLIADLRRYGSLFDSKRFWLHEHALRQVEREENASLPNENADALGHLPRIAAFLTPVSLRIASGARVTFVSGPLTVTIKRAGDESRHPGSFYVRGLTGFGESGSIYAGRISPEGYWFPTTAGMQETAIFAMLDEFEQGPAEYAASYGQRTGMCCFCARHLDDPVSIGLGYGPICAKHYGLSHGKRALAAAVKMRCERVTSSS